MYGRHRFHRPNFSELLREDFPFNKSFLGGLEGSKDTKFRESKRRRSKILDGDLKQRRIKKSRSLGKKKRRKRNRTREAPVDGTPLQPHLRNIIKGFTGDVNKVNSASSVSRAANAHWTTEENLAVADAWYNTTVLIDDAEEQLKCDDEEVERTHLKILTKFYNLNITKFEGYSSYKARSGKELKLQYLSILKGKRDPLDLLSQFQQRTNSHNGDERLKNILSLKELSSIFDCAVYAQLTNTIILPKFVKEIWKMKNEYSINNKELLQIFRMGVLYYKHLSQWKANQRVDSTLEILINKSMYLLPHGELPGKSTRKNEAAS